MTVTQDLLVAAGGGGDAIAAYMVADREAGNRPIIATWAWDRLMVDPLPGPRSARDFDGLSSPAPDVYLIETTTKPVPPSGSTLPRLAAELDATLLLLDPTNGCRGLARQLRAAAKWAHATRAVVVDVGGDCLGQPGDPGLRSPLADVTTVVATLDSGLPADLIVVGPGCDGELSPELVRERLAGLGAQAVSLVSADQAKSVTSILEWHPSEATALVAMAALGYRGRVEIRDRGLPVDLAEHTAGVWCVPLAVLSVPDAIRRPIAESSSLQQLETVFHDLYGINEVDYERRKASALARPQAPVASRDVNEFLTSASERGAEWVTRRRLREATGDVPEAFTTSLLVPTS